MSSREAEGIEFVVKAIGETPLDAAQKASRLARNLLSDWHTDWPVEITNAEWQKTFPGWRAVLTGFARDDSRG